MELYYYNQMNKQQQSVYHAMKTGLTALAPSFPVHRLENHELSDIFFKLRLDCPEIFYAVSFRYRFFPNSDNAQMIPEYLFEKGKIREHQKAMRARVEKLCRPAQVLSELLRLLEQTAGQKGKHARVGLNWPQAVFQVSFTEEMPAEELVVEEANEGEKE